MLLPLHRTAGRPVSVNTDLIWTLDEPDHPADGGTRLQAVTGAVVFTRETPAEILAMLGLPNDGDEMVFAHKHDGVRWHNHGAFDPNQCHWCGQQWNGWEQEAGCRHDAGPLPEHRDAMLPPKHPAFQSMDDENRYLRGER